MLLLWLVLEAAMHRRMLIVMHVVLLGHVSSLIVVLLGEVLTANHGVNLWVASRVLGAMLLRVHLTVHVLSVHGLVVAAHAHARLVLLLVPGPTMLVILAVLGRLLLRVLLRIALVHLWRLLLSNPVVHLRLLRASTVACLHLRRVYIGLWHLLVLALVLLLWLLRLLSLMMVVWIGCSLATCTALVILVLLRMVVHYFDALIKMKKSIIDKL